jgi:hypothetical protein
MMAMNCECIHFDGKDSPISRVGACLHFIPEKKGYLLFGGERSTLVQELLGKSASSSGSSTKLPKNDKVYIYSSGTIQEQT